MKNNNNNRYGYCREFSRIKNDKNILVSIDIFSYKRVIIMMVPKSIEQIAEKYGIVLVYLFGSKAKNTNSNLSDIDIAVLLENNNEDRLKDIVFLSNSI